MKKCERCVRDNIPALMELIQNLVRSLVHSLPKEDLLLIPRYFMTLGDTTEWSWEMPATFPSQRGSPLETFLWQPWNSSMEVSERYLWVDDCPWIRKLWSLELIILHQGSVLRFKIYRLDTYLILSCKSDLNMFSIILFAYPFLLNIHNAYLSSQTLWGYIKKIKALKSMNQENISRVLKSLSDF